MNKQDLTEKIVSLSKRRGFIFQSSEIYGGLNGCYDYGPLGVELLRNIKESWWKDMTYRENIEGLDASILMHPRVWEASGHVESFTDPMVDCKECKARFRADQLDDALCGNKAYKGRKAIKCMEEGKFTEARQFNLMFKTFIGPVEDSSSAVFLRPETAQGIYVNFLNVQSSSRQKIPFGIAQVGKCFRNEITPGNFIFRTIEFDLMEFEWFIKEEEWEKWFDYWLDEMKKWLDIVGIDGKNTRIREHTKDELSHYSKRTVDIEYNTPFGGWKELYGLAYRTDFDLKNHQEHSGKDQQYFDPETNNKFIPHVIEPTFGLTRSVLMVLLNAYTEEEVKDAKGNAETRIVLKLNKNIAPFKVAVLPLVGKLNDDAKKVYEKLAPHFNTDFDTTGSIGKRYRRQDEIGTPYCVTFDFDSLDDKAVTVRDRDSMKQDRVDIEELIDYLSEKLK